MNGGGEIGVEAKRKEEQSKSDIKTVKHTPHKHLQCVYIRVCVCICAGGWEKREKCTHKWLAK